MTATCRICLRPLTAVSDDPDRSHPSCAPADPPAFEAATHGPRTYRGVLRAIHWSTCPCGTRIDEGAGMWLMDTATGRRWVHSETCLAVSPSAPSAALSPGKSTPAAREAVSEPHSPSYGAVPATRTTTDTDAPRRAVA